MADRWRVVLDEPAVSVQRNGSWYTDCDDIEEAEALLRNQRAREYVLVDRDGYPETRRL